MKKNNNKKWTEEELKWLAANKDRPTKKLAGHLGRTVAAVWARKHSEGLTKPTDCARKWTCEEIDALREMAEEWPWKVRETAERLGRTEKAVTYMCWRLGLSPRKSKYKWMDTHIVFAPALSERRKGGEQ